jgi:hypothetical protein
MDGESKIFLDFPNLLEEIFYYWSIYEHGYFLVSSHVNLSFEQAFASEFSVTIN